jgi:chromosomal replication initiation ATPase DnaA
MSEEFTKEEVKILKKICENPIFKNFQPLPTYKVHTPLTLQSILEKVCTWYEIPMNEFMNERREKHLIYARRDFCHLAIKNTTHSRVVIGRAMKKDSSTVIHHLKHKPIHADKIII